MSNSSSNSTTASSSSSSSSSSDSSVENNVMMQKVLNVFSGVLDSVPSDQQMRMEFLLQFSKLQELIVRSRNCMDIQATRVNQLYEVIKSQREKIIIHEDVMKKIEANQNDVIDTSNTLNKFSQNLSIEFQKLKELYELQMNKISDLNEKIQMSFLKSGDLEVRYSRLEYCLKKQKAQIQLLLSLNNNNNSPPIQEDHKSCDMNIERQENKMEKDSSSAYVNIANPHTFQELKKLDNANWTSDATKPLIIPQKNSVTLDVAFNSSKYLIQSTKISGKLKNKDADVDENGFLFNNNVDIENDNGQLVKNNNACLSEPAINEILNPNLDDDDGDGVQFINMKKLKLDNISAYVKQEYIDIQIQSPPVQSQSPIEGGETSILNNKQITTFDNQQLINNPINDSNSTNLFEENSIQQLQNIVANQASFSNAYLQEQEQCIADTNNDSNNSTKESRGQDEDEREVAVVDNENKNKQNSCPRNTLNKNQKTKQPNNQKKYEKKDYTRTRRTQEQLMNMQAATYTNIIDNTNKK